MPSALARLFPFPFPFTGLIKYTPPSTAFGDLSTSCPRVEYFRFCCSLFPPKKWPRTNFHIFISDCMLLSSRCWHSPQFIITPELELSEHLWLTLLCLFHNYPKLLRNLMHLIWALLNTLK